MATPPQKPDHPSATAIVVGLCAHGLAVVRGLAKTGIPVMCLEANRALPGFRTRLADVIHTPDINGPGLIDALKSLRETLPVTPAPVLFLTNDNMVRTVGRHWASLDGLYQLSWDHCKDSVLSLLNKSSLEAHCQTHQLPYPKTWVYDDPSQPGGHGLDALQSQGLTFPLIVKPSQPLSGFKVRLVHDRAALEELAAAHEGALPFLLQHWVQGDDRRILFVAFYLEQGRILAQFSGRKLASRPPAMGQTTVAESFTHEAMADLAERFFRPLKLSGPVSLEAKLDDQGQPWIIEPTLGRTDYWLDCCIANGVNLPLVEYLSQSGQPTTPSQQSSGVIWFDTENSPLSFWRMRLRSARQPKWRARFAYWDAADPLPFLHAVYRVSTRVLARATRWVVRRVRR